MTETMQSGAGAPPTPEVILPAQRPGDSQPFERMASSYNFETTSETPRVFARLVLDELVAHGGGARVLDIGCGRGIARKPALVAHIRKLVGDFWGIEPDASATPEAGLFDHFEHALMEGATLPQGRFDVVYSYMVMEHVEQPEQFMKAVMGCLKPGGVYLFATPNKRHYFARCASALRTLRVDELSLRLMVGSKKKDDYHFPVQYKFNTEREIRKVVESLGGRAEFVYVESRGPKGYLKGVLRPVFEALRLKRKLVKSPRSLVTIICRVRKTG